MVLEVNTSISFLLKFIDFCSIIYCFALPLENLCRRLQVLFGFQKGQVGLGLELAASAAFPKVSETSLGLFQPVSLVPQPYTFFAVSDQSEEINFNIQFFEQT